MALDEEVKEDDVTMESNGIKLVMAKISRETSLKAALIT